MSQLENRIAEINGEPEAPPAPLPPKDPAIELADKLRAAQATMAGYKQARVDGFKQGLEELMKKFGVRMETRQLLINGMPAAPAEISIIAVD